MQTKWLRIDEAFKKRIVKRSGADCRKRFALDTIIALYSLTVAGAQRFE